MVRLTKAQEHEALRQQVERMDEKLDELLTVVRQLGHDVEQLSADVAETKELVAAWKAAKAWGTFVKWIAGLLAALFAVWAAWKGIPK
jgi:uncharacterized protein YlxW (UPF0749 family)